MERSFSGAYPLLEPDFANIGYDHFLKSDALRHQIRLHPRATHGYYVIDNLEDLHEPHLFKFCHGDDPYIALEQTRLDHISSLGSPPAPATTSTSRNPPHSESQTRLDTPSLVDSSSRPTMPRSQLGGRGLSSCSTDLGGHGTSLPPSLPVHAPSEYHSKTILQRAKIDNVERNALVPLYTVGQNVEDVLNTFYAIRMRVDEAHEEFAAYARKDYKLIVDTGEPNTWIYGDGFGLITDIEKDKFNVWSSESWLKKEHPPWVDRSAHEYRKVLPIPEGVQPLEEALRKYVDGTAAYLKRWGKSHAIPALFPCYDWKTNKDSRTTDKFLFPRVLATAVDPILAGRPYDGILGLCMLKWSHLLFRGKIDIGFVTFSDAMRWSHGGHVESASEYTLRLRFPDGDIEENDRSGSFLYFGNIWPCAIPTSNGPLVPKFTDEIPLCATSVGSSSSYRTLYMVQATLVTLYVPKHAEANHLSTDPQDWTAIPIVLRESGVVSEDPDDDATAAPMKLLLDSCASHSFFTPDVVEAIATKWLENDPRTIHTGLYCKSGHNFNKCDLVFRFVGVNGAEVDYRCNAGHFLTSPWPRDDVGVRSPIASQTQQGEDKYCTLGMNFFWTAFVRHVHKPKDHPYIQLAPQRFIDDVGNSFEQPYLKLHEGLSPRLESIRWGADTLAMK